MLRGPLEFALTTNQNYRQTYRAYVAVASTVDGVDVADIPYSQLHDPFIGRGRFTAVEVVHGVAHDPKAGFSFG